MPLLSSGFSATTVMGRHEVSFFDDEKLWETSPISGHKISTVTGVREVSGCPIPRFEGLSGNRASVRCQTKMYKVLEGK